MIRLPPGEVARRPGGWRPIVRRVAVATGILLLAVLALVAFGIQRVLRELPSRAAPAPSYAVALARFAEVQRREAALPLLPVARSRLLEHGRPTDRVIVLLHGLTNCPAQFEQLGQSLYSRGWNVYIPRLPRHGMADRRSANLTSLRADELREFADASVDLARGLGAEITVCGLSAGGTVGAWIAGHRPDVARAVLVAPATGLVRTDGFWLNRLAFLLLPLLPDLVTDRFTADPHAPPHCYPGFSSRSLGELLRLSAATIGQAMRRPPAVQDVALVTSRNDTAINDAVLWRLVSLWRARGLERFTAHDFPAAAGVQHDMIDPAQPYQRTAVVYPLLLDLIERRLDDGATAGQIDRAATEPGTQAPGGAQAVPVPDAPFRN